LTPEELAQYTATNTGQQASAPAQYPDWEPTDADSLDEDEKDTD
jgi:hypothetical protein